MVQDKLREVFLNDDSELGGFMPPGDCDGGRDEFLFHLFQLLVVGGTMCQSDECVPRALSLSARTAAFGASNRVLTTVCSLNPRYATEYFATVRAFYKELVSVYRKAEVC